MKLRNLLAAAALAAAFLASPAAAPAQQVDTLGVSTALWTACPGGTVRLALGNAETVSGRCGTVADGRLTVQAQDSERQIALAEVRQVWVRKSRIAEGAVFVSAVGLIAGYLIGIAGPEPVCVPGGCAEESSNGRRWRGAGIGAVVGAAAGALVGSRSTYWQQRHP